MTDNKSMVQTMKGGLLRPTRSIFWAILFAVLSACATTPVKLSDHELKLRTTEVLDSLFAQYPAVQHELTLGEVMARALLFNLDDRVQLLKIAIEQKAKNLGRLDLLPKLMLEAGYRGVSENLASYNKSTASNATRSTLAMISTEDESTQASLGLAWNVLDFGVSYVRSQQQADRILIAEARRQQTMQNVLADVRAEFWRAYAAQQWEPTVEELLADLKIGLENSRRAGDSGAVTKEEALRVQSALLETMGDLLVVKKRLTGAKNKLAALMNLRPGESYRLAVDKTVQEQIEKERKAGFVGLKLNDAQIEGLEEKALEARPELKIADYQVRIMRRETKRLMLSMLPGVDLSLGGYYDGNDFKKYDQYTRLGLNVAYDLVNLIKWPAHKQQAKNKVLLEKEKRKALTMAVLTQLHVALAQHALTQRRLNYADQLAQVDEKIFIESGNQLRVGATPPNKVLQSRLNFVESGLTRDWLFSERQRSVDQLYIASGISLAAPLPKSLIESTDPVMILADLSRSMTLRAGRLHDLGRAMEAHMVSPSPESGSSDSASSEIKTDLSVSKKVEPKPQLAKSKRQLMENSSLPVVPVKGGRAIESNDFWCVRTAYFTSESVTRSYIANNSAKASQELVTEGTGKGFIVRSRPLNFDDAYEFRAEARASFSPDAFIRRCERSTEHRLGSNSSGSGSSVVKPKPIVKKIIEPPTPEFAASKKPVMKNTALPARAVKGERSREAKDVWCVHTAYFVSGVDAQRNIEKNTAKSGAHLVVEGTGKGFIVRSRPLNFDDAYDFRAKARARFSPDAYIKRCQ